MISSAGYFTFGDVNSADYNVFVSGGHTYDAPSRDIEFVSIEGRNGDLVQDNGRFQNIEITYPAFISRTFNRDFDRFRSALYQMRGYQTLWDSYHPMEYRQAVLADGITPDTTARNLGGKFDITFNCKPQRFLLSGAQDVRYYRVDTGALNASGAAVDDSYTYRTEYIPVTVGDTFKARCRYVEATVSSYVLTVFCYNSSKTYTTKYASSAGLDQSVSFVVPSGTAYVRVMYGTWSSIYPSSTGVQITNGGETTVYGDGGAFIINPTGYVSRPLITHYGQLGGSLRVDRRGATNNIIGDSTVVTINDFSERGAVSSVTLDSEIGNAYSTETGYAIDLNHYINIVDYSGQPANFPTFDVGGNMVSFTGCDYIDVKAGWWTV